MSEERRSEFRKYVRIRREHIIDCKKIVVPVRSDPEVAYQQLANLKASGLLMASQTMFDIDTLLRLSIAVPGWEEITEKTVLLDRQAAIVAIVRVVFVELCTDNTYDIGMQLLGIKESHQMGLVHYINTIVKKAC